MTLRSSCDSIKTPMEFDRCSHAIFHFFSKYLKTFNHKIKKIQAAGCMLNVIVFQFLQWKTDGYYTPKHLDKSVLFKSFHLLLTNTKIINQYRLTYTLCGGLNRLQVYVTEIKEKQIFKRIRWQTWALFECVFYKFAVPVQCH